MKKIIAYKRYYSDFMAKLSQPERIKIMRALLLFETEDKIPHHYIKYIRDGIYEFRVNYGSNEFRIFFIYDGDTVVVLFNCFKKKTQKTPDSEIKKLFEFYRKIFLYLRYYFGFFESILASFLSCFLEIARYSLQNNNENLLKIALK